MNKRCIGAILTLSSLLLCLFNLSYGQSKFNNISVSTPFDFPVLQIVTRPAPYADFCLRTPVECALKDSAIIKMTPQVMALLTEVNSQVNSEIHFLLDIDQYNREEYWTLPYSGSGDCEDIALEKRYRLVQQGYPRAAMRITIVSHKQFLHTHALLSLETDAGTYVMNSFTDEVKPWKQVPYNFESRERTDGLWERFDQSLWTYGP